MSWRDWVFRITAALCIVLALFLVWWGWGYSIRTSEQAFHDEWALNDARGKSPLAAHDEAVLYILLRPFMIVGGLLLIPTTIFFGTVFLLEPRPPRPRGRRRYQFLSPVKRELCAFGGALMFFVALTVVAFLWVCWQREGTEWGFHLSLEDTLIATGIFLALTLLASRLPLGDLWLAGGGLLTTLWTGVVLLFWAEARSDPYYQADPVFSGVMLVAGAVSIGSVVFGRRLNRIIEG